MFVPKSKPAVDPAAAAAGLYAAALKNILGFRVAGPMKKKDLDYNQELAGLYVEAARRLPIAEIPCLADCISMSGLAVGLADPVTNIVLTTIDAFANSPSPRLCVRPLKPDDALEKTSCKASFAVAARNSRAGLVAFLLCYFRHLRVEQANKILDMAGHHLPLAVLLVELGCWGLEVPPPHLDPDAARTRTALQQAGDNAEQCSITGDSLVRLMTARYHLLDVPAAILHDLQAGNKLTSDSIYKISHLLRRCSPSSSSTRPPLQQPTPAPPTPGTCRDTCGNVTTILKIRKDVFATTTISKDLVATTTFHSTSPSSSCALLDSSSSNDDDDDAVYLSTQLATEISPSSLNTRVSLWRDNPDFLPLMKTSLLDTVHGFYIDALRVLPTHALRDRHLLRSILTAGHFYGPLDPVSNIIVNTIWYDNAFPLSEHVSNQIGPQAADILDARSLSRVESRSLDNLVAFVCYTYAISEQQAVVLLCEHRFDLSRIFQDKILSDLAVGALVAKHPQPSAFQDFLSSLIPPKLDGLTSLICDKGLRHVLSDDTMDRLKILVTDGTTRIAAAAPSGALDLGKSALDALSARRKTFKSQQDYVRTKLGKLLLDYSRDKGHFYELGIVCGLTKERYGFYSSCYHINFLASKDVPNESTTRSWELFFAEFWSIVDIDVEHSANVPFCCPVRDSFNAYCIRCSICDKTSCKIAHPTCGDYVYFTGNTEYDFPVYHEWGSDLGGMLESDFIYFDHESDDELAKILSKESSNSSPKKSGAREEFCSSPKKSKRGVFFVPEEHQS